MLSCSSYHSDSRVINAAEALVDRGHLVDVLCLADDRPSTGPKRASPRLHRLRMTRSRSGSARSAIEYGVFFAWAMVMVGFLHFRHRFDLVYVHNMPNFLVFAAVVPRIGGAKVVLDIHDPVPELLTAIRAEAVPGWLLRLARAEERASVVYADAIITVSEPMRQRLVASAGTSAPVAVVMNLPDPRVFRPSEPSREPGGCDSLVYSGTVAQRQGVDLIIKAIARLAHEFPDLHLRLIGHGPATEEVLALVAQLGVGERVDFLGARPLHELPSVMQGACAGISAHRDGTFGSLVFSTKVPEYLSLGLPVISAGTATMRHYFRDDELLFFEPGSAEDLARKIRDSLRDPGAALQRAVRGRQRLDELNWSTQRETLVRTVEALIAEGGRP